MKSKFFFVPLLLGLSCAFSACNSKPEYRDAEENLSYAIKKIDGKRQWGLFANVRIDQPSQVIPYLYDSIYSIDKTLKYAYVCVKGAVNYAYSCDGKKLFNGSFTSFDFVPENDPLNSAYISGRLVVRFCGAEGNHYVMFEQYYSEPGEFTSRSSNGWPEYRKFGPYENFFAGKESAMFSQNGKWGLSVIKIGDKRLAGRATYEVTYVTVKEPQYDGIIEVSGGDPFWLVKTGSTWAAIDASGNAIKMSQSAISGYLRIKIIGWARYNSPWQGMRPRVGSENVGAIRLYKAW